MRAAFVKALVEAAKSDSRVVLMTGGALAVATAFLFLPIAFLARIASLIAAPGGPRISAPSSTDFPIRRSCARFMTRRQRGSR